MKNTWKNSESRKNKQNLRKDTGMLYQFDYTGENVAPICEFYVGHKADMSSFTRKTDWIVKGCQLKRLQMTVRLLKQAFCH